MKHTNGEWYAGVLDMTDGLPTTNIMSDKGMSHPRVAKSLSGNVEENKANAKLMAAAPELLDEHATDIDLLREAIDYIKKGKSDAAISHIRCVLVSKRQVIKKATE